MNTDLNIYLVKEFDKQFSSLYSELNYTPSPVNYTDEFGKHKTYIYKSNYEQSNSRKKRQRQYSTNVKSL